MLPVIPTPHKDPAPSRIRYRLHRLWLRPAVRNLILRGLPILALALAGANFVADPTIRTDIQSKMLQLRNAVAARPEFVITEMSIPDVSENLEVDIRASVGLAFPQSSLTIEVTDIRDKVMALDAVRTANVRIRADGRLDIQVEERVPAVVWRSANKLVLLDAGGVLVGELTSRGERGDLPLVVGTGADRNVTEAMEILRTSGQLASRIRGLVRVGERRWDIILDRDQRIQLPETGAKAALERVMALDAAEELLERDISVVDMRVDARPVLRLSPRAVEELRRLRRIKDGDDA